MPSYGPWVQSPTVTVIPYVTCQSVAFSREGLPSFAATVAASSSPSAPTGPAGALVLAHRMGRNSTSGNAFLSGGSTTVRRDNPPTGGTATLNYLQWAASFVRMGPPQYAGGAQGPAFNGADPTPPTGATGWELDPLDATGGQWVGDFTLDYGANLPGGDDYYLNGRASLQAQVTRRNFFPPLTPVDVPGFSARLRVLPAAFWTANTSGSSAIVTDATYPGPGASGDLVAEFTAAPQTPQDEDSTAQLFDMTTATAPGADILALHLMPDWLEGGGVMPSSYTPPSTGSLDFFVAFLRNLTVHRSLRPQRWRWIGLVPDAPPLQQSPLQQTLIGAGAEFEPV